MSTAADSPPSPPSLWVLAHPLAFGPTGVFVAACIGYSTISLVSAWLFSKGYWKTKRI
jgi:Na+-driven multidrug efflux pump